MLKILYIGYYIISCLKCQWGYKLGLDLYLKLVYIPIKPLEP